MGNPDVKPDRSRPDRWIALYKDDGPIGMVPQSMSITAPWTKLYVYGSEEDARAFKRYLDRDNLGRRNARVEAIFSDTWETVEDGPIVPEADRAA